jgi:uncharacterized membrane protein
MTFDDGEMAQTVYEALLAMRKSQVLGLGDSVIVSTDSVGQIRFHQGSEEGTSLAPVLAEMILRSPEGEASELDRVKLDADFLDTVVAALRRNHSALLFFIDSDGLSDTCELLNALALFNGTIHQTTLPPQSKALLRGRPQ